MGLDFADAVVAEQAADFGIAGLDDRHVAAIGQGHDKPAVVVVFRKDFGQLGGRGGRGSVAFALIEEVHVGLQF